MLDRLRCMLIKEFLQMLRDPRMRMVVFVAPLIQMTVFAFALTTDVTHIQIALADLDRTPDSRELAQAFTASGHFEITRQVYDQAELRRVLDAGEVRAVLHIAAGFAQRLRGGRAAPAQLLVDANNSNDAAIILGYANQIVGQYARQRQRQAYAARFGAAAGFGEVRLETRAWFNPNLESKYYFVPGLIAVMLMVVGTLLTSIAVVREKEIGTIEQIMVTPIGRLEFILGKTIPYLITGYITMTLMFAVAMLLFDVRIAGDWALLYALAGVYLTGNIGLALLISAGAATQQQALLTAFLFLMPNVLLSGFLFPVRNMPEAVQYLTLVNPMRWFLEILHGIVLKGTGVAVLWPAMAALGALAVLFIGLAALRFKKTLG